MRQSLFLSFASRLASVPSFSANAWRPAIAWYSVHASVKFNAMIAAVPRS
jgi:hypothetical protein